jgi:enolase
LSGLSYRIRRVDAREILDSRGNPTVQVDVWTDSGFGRFAVPSGASKGQFESLELRDGDPNRYLGMGVRKAVVNVTKTLGPAVTGMDARNQADVDGKLLKLDGTKNKSHFGANAILGVSLAVFKAAAATTKTPPYRLALQRGKPLMPVPMLNIVNGGKHAGNDLSFQEFMIMPLGFRRFAEALRCGSEVYHVLGDLLKRKFGKGAVNVGDEGGFAPPLSRVRDALELVELAVGNAGYSPGKEVVLGIDPAPGSFYDDKTGKYSVDGERLAAGDLYDMYVSLCKSFPLRSIEDPFHDEDFESFARLTKQMGSKTQIIGDDLFVTNSERIEKGIALHAANALLVKVNQAGTLTETIEAIEKARGAGYGLVMSHRSGETEDTTIADLAVGLATGQIKAGAPARGERTVKYNRLLEIESELGTEARFFGPEFLKTR